MKSACSSSAGARDHFSFARNPWDRAPLCLSPESRSLLLGFFTSVSEIPDIFSSLPALLLKMSVLERIKKQNIRSKELQGKNSRPQALGRSLLPALWKSRGRGQRALGMFALSHGQ